MLVCQCLTGTTHEENFILTQKLLSTFAYIHCLGFEVRHTYGRVTVRKQSASAQAGRKGRQRQEELREDRVCLAHAPSELLLLPAVHFPIILAYCESTEDLISPMV